MHVGKKGSFTVYMRIISNKGPSFIEAKNGP